MLEAFLERLDEFHDRLEGYVQDGNVQALAAIEARVVAAGEDTRRERAARAGASAAEGGTMNDMAKAGIAAGAAGDGGRGRGDLPGSVPDGAALRRDDPPRALTRASGSR